MLRNLNRVSARGRILGTCKVGVLGADIPDDGGAGPSALYAPDLEPTHEYRFKLLTWPATGSLFLREDGSGTFIPAADGVETATGQWYDFNVPVGAPRTLTFESGEAITRINCTVGNANAAGATAEVIQTTRIICTVGNANAEGLNAGITSSSGTVISCGVGNANAEGAQASVYLGTVISCGVGNANAAGLTASIQNGAYMSFTPSAARTVSVHPGSQAFTAGSFWNMSDPTKPRGTKDPNSTIDVTFDWTAYLADVEDEIAPGGLEFVLGEGLEDVGFEFDGALCSIFLAAGTALTTSPILCRITTSSIPPRVEDRTVYLSIEDR